jgi:hypothetical protein
VTSSSSTVPLESDSLPPPTTNILIQNTTSQSDGKVGGIQVFVVTAPAHEKYRDRFLANADGWHHEFPDLQVYTFDEVPTNVTSLRSYSSRIHQIQMLPFEANEQRNNLLLASFGAIYKHNPNADWYLLTEDDTILVKQNLDQLVARMSPKRDIYMGKCVQGRPTKRFGVFFFIMGGSGVLMSGSLLSKLVPGIDTCRKDLAKFEHGDTRIAACLKTMDILPEKICALPEMKGYKFTSASAWWESTLPKNQRHLVLTMHEKEPDRIRILNDAVHDLVNLNKEISWKALRPYIEEKTASSINISATGTAT